VRAAGRWWISWFRSGAAAMGRRTEEIWDKSSACRNPTSPLLRHRWPFNYYLALELWGTECIWRSLLVRPPP
jgi:hypothetical protein